MPTNKFGVTKTNKGKAKQPNFGNYFEFVNGEKSTKFLEIINRAKGVSPIITNKEFRPNVP